MSLNIIKKNVMYIDVSDIDLYYRVHKNKIDTSIDTYTNFIKSDKKIHDDYSKICNSIMEHRARINKRNYKQLGSGAGIIVGITIGSIAIASIVAYLVWRYLNPTDLCKKTYPLYSVQYPDKIPAVEALLMTIIPKKWIDDKIKEGKNVSSAIKESGEYLDSLVETFKVFDTQVGTTGTRAVKTVSKITLSVFAAIITAGTVGDKIVNIPFFITKAINMVAKTYKKLQSVGQKIINEMAKSAKDIKKVGESVEIAFQSVEKIELFAEDVAKNTMIEMHNGKETMAFIYDLFNIGFNEGPQGSLCRVNYVIEHYIGGNKGLTSDEKSKYMYDLICVMNEIYVEINSVVIEFIGSALDMVVPDSMGLAGTLAPLLKGYSYEIYERVRDEITYDYDKIPVQYRDLIENPLELKEYLFDKFSTYTLGITDLVISPDVKKQLGHGIDVLADGIHKGMGMIFMFLNVFIIFSKINAGIDEPLGGIDVKKCKQYMKK